jgi:hypothetical protein
MLIVRPLSVGAGPLFFGTLFERSFLPTPRIALTMVDGKYRDASWLHAEIDPKREPPNWEPSNSMKYILGCFRQTPNPIKSLFNAKQKAFSKSLALSLIPCLGLSDVLFGFICEYQR